MLQPSLAWLWTPKRHSIKPCQLYARTWTLLYIFMQSFVASISLFAEDYGRSHVHSKSWSLLLFPGSFLLVPFWYSTGDKVGTRQQVCAGHRDVQSGRRCHQRCFLSSSRCSRQYPGRGLSLEGMRYCFWGAIDDNEPTHLECWVQEMSWENHFRIDLLCWTLLWRCRWCSSSPPFRRSWHCLIRNRRLRWRSKPRWRCDLRKQAEVVCSWCT